MRKYISEIVINAVKELNEDMGNTAFYSPVPSTLLYGYEGNLSSLGLVGLISEIESKIYERFDKNITLADESAMSRTKSPFKNIEVLSEFIEELLKEEAVAVVPGNAFNADGNFVRCCYATSYEQLEEALERIRRFMQRHG